MNILLLNNDVFSWAYLEIRSVTMIAGKTNMISHHAKGRKKINEYALIPQHEESRYRTNL
ncbi:hypothetical protein FXE62_19085 [Vibrio cholerae]|nr:hypothetical protein FXE62_19085 [Vibrio cholerae]